MMECVSEIGHGHIFPAHIIRRQITYAADMHQRNQHLPLIS